MQTIIMKPREGGTERDHYLHCLMHFNITYVWFYLCYYSIIHHQLTTFFYFFYFRCMTACFPFSICWVLSFFVLFPLYKRNDCKAGVCSAKSQPFSCLKCFSVSIWSLWFIKLHSSLVNFVNINLLPYHIMSN